MNARQKQEIRVNLENPRPNLQLLFRNPQLVTRNSLLTTRNSKPLQTPTWGKTSSIGTVNVMSPRRTRVARTSRTRPARRARLLTRRAKLNAARRPRRGVLLLVVLSLLVLFLMVGMAFVITAKQSEKAAKSAMKASVRLAGEAAQGPSAPHSGTGGRSRRWAGSPGPRPRGGG